MSIDIEAHGDHLTDLDVELRNAVATEDFETALLGILLQGLKDIRCYFPFCTRALRYATTFREYENNLT